jgi:hypothetical protein
MSEVRSMAVDREFDEDSLGWPPKGVRMVCTMPACGEVALATGCCVSHQVQLVRLLSGQFGDLVAASFAEARWYAERLGPRATLDQGIALKRAVVLSYSPVTALEQDSDQEAEDRAWGEVNDTGANRKRRGQLFSSLPDRIHTGVDDRSTLFDVITTFVLGMVVGAAIVIVLL